MLPAYFSTIIRFYMRPQIFYYVVHLQENFTDFIWRPC
jgi:hypothetical protein